MGVPVAKAKCADCGKAWARKVADPDGVRRCFGHSLDPAATETRKAAGAAGAAAGERTRGIPVDMRGDQSKLWTAEEIEAARRANPSMPRRRRGRSVRHLVRGRLARRICDGCGAEVSLAGELDVHHIHPVARGGKDDADNLIVLCAMCHRRAHLLVPTDGPCVVEVMDARWTRRRLVVALMRWSIVGDPFPGGSMDEASSPVSVRQ